MTHPSAFRVRGNPIYGRQHVSASIRFSFVFPTFTLPCTWLLTWLSHPPKELMMRVAAVLRRSGKAEPQENAHEVVEIQGMKVDFTARRVTVDGETVDLSPKEYELLFYMVRNRGIALSRDRLISEVWGFDFFGDDRTLDTHIKLLRKQLGDYARYITTLRGVGYRFEKEDV